MFLQVFCPGEGVDEITAPRPFSCLQDNVQDASGRARAKGEDASRQVEQGLKGAADNLKS